MTPLLVGLALAVAAPGPKEAPKKDGPTLVGDWVVETVVKGGRPSAEENSALTFTADGKAVLKERGKTIDGTYTSDPKKDPAELDRILALLEEQKPLLRDYTTDHVAGMTGGDVDIAHCWSGDWVQMSYDMDDVRYVIPSEGSIKGNDVMVVLAGAPHPIAAHLWIDFNLDATISAENTNYIGYMGPNEAAYPMIEDYIIDDPRLNPPAEELAKLTELAYLQPADLAEYTNRWTALRA